MQKNDPLILSKKVYKVGIYEKKWVAITNGTNILVSDNTSDLRYLPKPPSQSSASFDYISILTSNRHSKGVIHLLDLPQIELFEFLSKQSIFLRGEQTFIEKIFSMFRTGLYWFCGSSILFFLLQGQDRDIYLALFQASFVGLFFGWFGKYNEFRSDNLQNVYLSVNENFEEWGVYLDEKKKEEQDKKEKELINIKKKWQQYFKLKSLSEIDSMDGYEFEAAIARLYDSRGYDTEITPASGDYGVDVLARKGSEILAIQAKRYSGKVGNKAVQEILAGATYYNANIAIVITNSFYTEPAKKLAKSVGVKLINKNRLAKMWADSFPDTEIPAFDLKKYEEMKEIIEKELYRVKRAR